MKKSISFIFLLILFLLVIVDSNYLFSLQDEIISVNNLILRCNYIIFRIVRNPSVITPEVRKILFDDSVTSPEEFKERLIAIGTDPEDVDSEFEAIKLQVEEEIQAQFREIFDNGIGEFTIFDKFYNVGLSDIDGDMNKILAKIGSSYRVMVAGFGRGYEMEGFPVAFGRIIDESLIDDFRVFVFGDFAGSDEFNNLPQGLCGMTDNIGTTVILSNGIEENFDSFVRLVFDNDLSQARSAYPELEQTLKKEALTSYGMDSKETSVTNSHLFIYDHIESVKSHEFGHIHLHKEIDDPALVGLSLVIKGGNNLFFFLDETIADLESISNIIKISKIDKGRATRMALQWLAFRSLAIGGVQSADVLSYQVIVSTLLSFMERAPSGELKIRFTGENSLEEVVNNQVLEGFKLATRAGLNLVKSYIQSRFKEGEFEKVRRSFREELLANHPGVEIPEEIIEQGFWMTIYDKLTSLEPNFVPTVESLTSNLLVNTLWSIILNNPDVVGEYAGREEYKPVNFTAYILDKARELGFIK